MPFDWTAIIDRNRAELARLLAVLLVSFQALLGGQLSRKSYCAVLRQLRPLESALRRLIVIMARGLVVAPRAVGMPQGALSRGHGAARGTCFPLFDARRQLGRAAFAGKGPQIRCFDEGTLPRAAEAAPLDITALQRRLARLQRALGRLPQEAQRLARWRMRHAQSLKRPMRPGRPPGYRDRAGDDPVQDLLHELQGLALWAMAGDV